MIQPITLPAWKRQQRTKDQWYFEISGRITDHWIPGEIVDWLVECAFRFWDAPTADRAYEWVNGGGIIIGYRPWLKAALAHDDWPFVWLDDVLAEHDPMSDVLLDMNDICTLAFENWFWHQYRHIMNYEGGEE